MNPSLSPQISSTSSFSCQQISSLCSSPLPFYSSSCSLNPISTTTTFTKSSSRSTNGFDGTGNPDTPQATIDLPSEFLAFSSGQVLPLGFNANFDSDTFHPSVGQACTRFPDELSRFMTYKVNGSCPDDELSAQKLLLKGCEPLPRRRCRPAAQPDYVEPYPLPTSLWTIPTQFFNCFDLQGRESNRWASRQIIEGSLDFTIDEVLAAKNPGTIRIGLDIGGGVATFAVRMRERNISIVTTSMNLNGPFNNFIASRGVVPLYISISQRLPFFDNTLDIVHSMHVLSNWIPSTLLHFLMFDIYRVLRPGGLFWLDHFFCVEDQFLDVYKPLIESIGFIKLKWVVGKKLDRGAELREMYLSALLEKPLKNSW
ncbi:hypothetical protein OIU74_027541 [Salix koriyanagi]|uniref:Methyltransferase type 11 domain-containing protein n=1 Tax=Salix koriyanagi TaxID=2511006 RepID=A0A9Q0VPP9_9ROSI|nr:hypothetical protein OIU74_027541 [Salix koriyanagi]